MKNERSLFVILPMLIAGLKSLSKDVILPMLIAGLKSLSKDPIHHSPIG